MFWVESTGFACGLDLSCGGCDQRNIKGFQTEPFISTLNSAINLPLGVKPLAGAFTGQIRVLNIAIPAGSAIILLV